MSAGNDDPVRPVPDAVASLAFSDPARVSARARSIPECASGTTPPHHPDPAPNQRTARHKQHGPRHAAASLEHNRPEVRQRLINMLNFPNNYIKCLTKTLLDGNCLPLGEFPSYNINPRPSRVLITLTLRRVLYLGEGVGIPTHAPKYNRRREARQASFSPRPVSLSMVLVPRATNAASCEPEMVCCVDAAVSSSRCWCVVWTLQSPVTGAGVLCGRFSLQ